MEINLAEVCRMDQNKEIRESGGCSRAGKWSQAGMEDGARASSSRGRETKEKNGNLRSMTWAEERLGKIRLVHFRAWIEKV